MMDFAGSLDALKTGVTGAWQHDCLAKPVARNAIASTGGGVVGPDLTWLARARCPGALLESIIEPSKVVAETYRNVAITTKAGLIYEGRISAKTTRSSSSPPTR